MGDVLGYFNLLMGAVMSFIGFKIFNPFEGKKTSEEEYVWYHKFGSIFKYGGIAMFILGTIQSAPKALLQYYWLVYRWIVGW